MFNVARFLVTGHLFLLSLSVSAQGTQTEHAWDVSVRAGYSHLQDTIAGFPNQDRPPWAFEYDPGSSLSLAARYEWTPHWRTEVEFSHRAADLTQSSPDNSAATGEFTLRAYMINAYYSFDLSSRLKPYVGLGIGDSHVRLDDFEVSGVPRVSDEARAAALQLIAGIDYHLSERWNLSVDYRHLRTRDLLFVDADGDIMETDARTHSVFLGLSRRW